MKEMELTPRVVFFPLDQTKIPSIPLSLHQKDVEQGITIDDVYYSQRYDREGNSLVRYFVVFSDEIHPIDPVDKGYRPYRKRYFGSLKDIVPINLLTLPLQKQRKIFYEDARNQKYDVTSPHHYPTLRITRIDDGIPVFFASTWNHLFSMDGCVDSTISIRPKPLPKGYAIEEKFKERFDLFEKFYHLYKDSSENRSTDYLTVFFEDLNRKLSLNYNNNFSMFIQDAQLNKIKFKFLV